MRTFILRRILISIPVILLVTMIMYLIINLAPGDPISMLVMQEGLAPAEIEKIRIDLGLNQPIHVRYYKWLGQMVRGNLGYSFLDHQPVIDRLAERLAPTFSLMLFVIVVSYSLAVPIGVISAVRQYSWIDYLATALAFFGVSFPNFFSGLVGIYFFSLTLHWLPTGGLQTIGQAFSLADRLHHLILPGLVLALREVGVLVRYTRSSMLDVILQDYIRTARAGGLSEWSVILRHALRNALLPLITMLGLTIPRLFAGVVIIEQIFQWPGMGRLAIEAILSRDYPVLMGLTLCTAIMVLLGNLLADVLYGVADPRIRLAGRR
ncbi:MAG: ABC transporter permease [Thermodesulfobacteriota bacterium]